MRMRVSFSITDQFQKEVLNENGFVITHMSSRVSRIEYQGVTPEERARNILSEDRDCIYLDYYNNQCHYAVQFNFLEHSWIRKIKHEGDLQLVIEYFNARSKKKRYDTAKILYYKLDACDWETPDCSYECLI